MEPSPRTELTREQLYQEVWTTPVRILALKYGLSDVGLAKTCKRFGIPRPPVGYWAKLEHGKAVDRPELPPPPDGAGPTIVIVDRAIIEESKTAPPSFFDEQIRALADQLNSGELVEPVAHDLRGCSAITRQTREAIEIASRKPKRDQWGVLQYPPRYELPHLEVSVSKDKRQRALLLADAIVKSLQAIGCIQRKSRDDWRHSVLFEFRGLEFRLRIREGTRRVAHVLTESEEQAKARYGRSFARKHDWEHTGQLVVELLLPERNESFFEVRDGKRSGQLEGRVADVALAMLIESDRRIQRAHEQRLAAQRLFEQQRREREEAERRRIEEERRKQEIECRDRLIGMAEDRRTAAMVKEFLAEVEPLLANAQLDEQDRDLMQRWLRWAERVVRDLDPFGRPLKDFPEVTHPGIKEREKREHKRKQQPSLRRIDQRTP